MRAAPGAILKQTQYVTIQAMYFKEHKVVFFYSLIRLIKKDV